MKTFQFLDSAVRIGSDSTCVITVTHLKDHQNRNRPNEQYAQPSYTHQHVLRLSLRIAKPEVEIIEIKKDVRLSGHIVFME